MQRDFEFMSQSLQGINISSIVLRPNLKASEAQGKFNHESLKNSKQMVNLQHIMRHSKYSYSEREEWEQRKDW